jgi:hypothetical protein
MDKAHREAGIRLALTRDDAPRDIADYQWYEAEVDGETFNAMTFPDGTRINLNVSEMSSYGEMAVGSDVATRRAAVAFIPHAMQRRGSLINQPQFERLFTDPDGIGVFGRSEVQPRRPSPGARIPPCSA